VKVKNSSTEARKRKQRKKQLKENTEKKANKKHNRHQHNTDDGGQGVGEETQIDFSIQG